MPVNSGSRRGAMTILDATVPANPWTGGSGLPCGAMAASRSQINDLETPPTWEINCHMPANRSPDCREGNITASSHRENVNVITNTGNIRDRPNPQRRRANSMQSGEVHIILIAAYYVE